MTPAIVPKEGYVYDVQQYVLKSCFQRNIQWKNIEKPVISNMIPQEVY